MKFQRPFRNKFSIVLFTALCFLTLPLVCAAQERIAFSSLRDGNYEIYVMDTDGTNQTRRTNNSAFDDEPSFSPDGSKIAFVSDRDGNREIYVMNADGTNVNRLTINPATDENPSFSADGSKIVFISHSFTAPPEVYVMNANGSNQIRLTSNTDFELFPAFSPDGGKITFVSDRDGGDLEIYVMNVNGSNQTRLTYRVGTDTEPKFNRNGSKIVFTSSIGGGLDIFVMDANGANPANLTNNGGVNASPSFSPNDSKIVFNLGGSVISVMNANGTSQTNLTILQGNRFPSWGGLPNTAPTITAAVGVTRARGAGASNSSIASVNDAEDAENTLSVTVNGSSSATSNGVTISGIAVDSSGNATANIAATCGANNAGFTLRVTDSGALFAEAMLNVAVTAETISPMISLPSNIVTNLPLNSTDTGKIVNFTISATDNCDANPTIAAVPAPGSAFAVGITTVNVTATDASGNMATGSFTVTVLYNFAGFFQPVDNLPTVNTVNAGQAIPVKFSLSGSKGLNIFAAGFPASQQIACATGLPVSPVEETVTAGSSSLSYDAGTDRYIYVWKTAKAWKGTCRQLIVKLNDGSLHVAKFQFK